jgi:hypothetical protein
MQWRLVEQAAAETATGFKKEKAHTAMGNQTGYEKISNPRQVFQQASVPGQGRFSRSSGPWLAGCSQFQLPDAL